MTKAVTFGYQIRMIGGQVITVLDQTTQADENMPEDKIREEIGKAIVKAARESDLWDIGPANSSLGIEGWAQMVVAVERIESISIFVEIETAAPRHAAAPDPDGPGADGPAI